MFEYVIVEKSVGPDMNLELNKFAQEGWRVVGFDVNSHDVGGSSYVALLEREKRIEGER